MSKSQGIFNHYLHYRPCQHCALLRKKGGFYRWVTWDFVASHKFSDVWLWWSWMQTSLFMTQTNDLNPSNLNIILDLVPFFLCAKVNIIFVIVTHTGREGDRDMDKSVSGLVIYSNSESPWRTTNLLFHKNTRRDSQEILYDWEILPLDALEKLWIALLNELCVRDIWTALLFSLTKTNTINK